MAPKCTLLHFCLIFFLVHRVLTIRTDDKYYTSCLTVGTESYFGDYVLSNYSFFRDVHVLTTCILETSGIFRAGDFKLLGSNLDSGLWASLLRFQPLLGLQSEQNSKVMYADCFIALQNSGLKDPYQFGYAAFMCLEMVEDFDKVVDHLFDSSFYMKKKPYDLSILKGLPQLYGTFISKAVGHYDTFRNLYSIQILMEVSAIIFPNGLINWVKYEKIARKKFKNIPEDWFSRTREDCEDYLKPENFDKQIDQTTATFYCLEIGTSVLRTFDRIGNPTAEKVLNDKMVYALNYAITNDTAEWLGLKDYCDDEAFIYRYMTQMGYISANMRINWGKVQRDLEVDKPKWAAEMEVETLKYECKDVILNEKECPRCNQAHKSYWCLKLFLSTMDRIIDTPQKYKKRVVMKQRKEDKIPLKFFTQGKSNVVSMLQIIKNESPLMFMRLYMNDVRTVDQTDTYKELNLRAVFPGRFMGVGKSFTADNYVNLSPDEETFLKMLATKNVGLKIFVRRKLLHAYDICDKRKSLLTMSPTNRQKHETCFFRCVLQVLDYMYYDDTYNMELYQTDLQMVYSDDKKITPAIIKQKCRWVALALNAAVPAPPKKPVDDMPPSVNKKSDEVVDDEAARGRCLTAEAAYRILGIERMMHLTK